MHYISLGETSKSNFWNNNARKTKGLYFLIKLKRNKTQNIKYIMPADVTKSKNDNESFIADSGKRSAFTSEPESPNFLSKSTWFFLFYLFTVTRTELQWSPLQL